MKAKGIIFDFNGTLFFDTDLHFASWNQFTKEKLNLELSEKDFEEKILGRDNQLILESLFPEIDSSELRALSEEKEAIYRQMCDSSGKQLVKGSEAFFDFLKESQIPFTIATGSNRSNVNYYFEHFHLDRWFDYKKIVCDDGHIKGKPEPDVYLEALQKLQISADDCLVFEDSAIGIQAAQRAGIKHIVKISMKENEVNTLSDFTQAAKLFESF